MKMVSPKIAKQNKNLVMFFGPGKKKQPKKMFSFSHFRTFEISRVFSKLLKEPFKIELMENSKRRTKKNRFFSSPFSLEQFLPFVFSCQKNVYKVIVVLEWNLNFMNKV